MLRLASLGLAREECTFDEAHFSSARAAIKAKGRLSTDSLPSNVIYSAGQCSYGD